MHADLFNSLSQIEKKKKTIVKKCHQKFVHILLRQSEEWKFIERENKNVLDKSDFPWRSHFITLKV